MSTSTRDIAWLAGLLEGEGSFTLSASRGRSIYVTLSMSDRDTVKKAAALLQPKSVREIPPRSGGTKTMYSIGIAGSKAAQWMMTLYPLMGERRQEKIRECLLFWRTLPQHGKSGTKTCVHGVVGKTACKKCHADYQRKRYNLKTLKNLGYDTKGFD